MKDKLNPIMPAILTFGLGTISTLFYLVRFMVKKRAVRLVMVCACLGWSLLGLVLLNIITKAYYDSVAWLGCTFSLMMTVAMFRRKSFDDYWEEQETSQYREAEDRKLRGGR